MGAIQKSIRSLVERPEGKRPLGRPRCRWEDNIKTDLMEVDCDAGGLNDLVQDRDQRQVYLIAVMALRVP